MTKKSAMARSVVSWLASGALAMGGLTVLGFAGAASAEAAPMVPVSAPATPDRVARFEVDFMQDMIDHHHMAVMMAEMCVEKAVHPDLASMCESIVTTQMMEIGEMQAWLEEWYGITYEPSMTGMGSMQRFERLSGEEFEIAFMRSMIRHHWGAIREANRCLDTAEHEELLSLCEDIRSAQLAEIEQMQVWLEEWYGLPGGRPV